MEPPDSPQHLACANSLHGQPCPITVYRTHDLMADELKEGVPPGWIVSYDLIKLLHICLGISSALLIQRMGPSANIYARDSARQRSTSLPRRYREVFRSSIRARKEKEKYAKEGRHKTQTIVKPASCEATYFPFWSTDPPHDASCDATDLSTLRLQRRAQHPEQHWVGCLTQSLRTYPRGMEVYTRTSDLFACTLSWQFLVPPKTASSQIAG